MTLERGAAVQGRPALPPHQNSGQGPKGSLPWPPAGFLRFPRVAAGRLIVVCDFFCPLHDHGEGGGSLRPPGATRFSRCILDGCSARGRIRGDIRRVCNDGSVPRKDRRGGHIWLVVIFGSRGGSGSSSASGGARRSPRRQPPNRRARRCLRRRRRPHRRP